MDNETLDYQKEATGLKQKLSSLFGKKTWGIFSSEAASNAQEFVNPIKLKPGQKAPDFTLFNALNKPVSLTDLIKKNKIILLFYRGQWCPFCNLVLTKYEMALPLFEKAGAKLVAISPQKPDFSLSQIEKENLSFEVLSDVNNEVGRKYTTIHKPSEKYIQTLKENDVDFYSYYDFDTGEIPVPAVFVINTNGEIIVAKSEGGDYAKRNDPNEIIKYL